MKKEILLALLFSFFFSGMYGQEIKVKAFGKLERDLSARTKPREDLNGNPCTIVKIVVANTKNFTFEGNVVGEPVYNEGEIWIYMPERTKRITIKNGQFGVLRYEFPARLDKQCVYEMKIKLVEDPEKKIRTLVMPVIGIGKGHPSYGIMLGIVRTTGPYLKVKYDFAGFSTSGECTDKGVLKGTDLHPWYTGEKKQNRFSVTAGVIQRLWQQPIYLYGGVGYGYNKFGWETVDGNWLKNTDHSSSGVEAELGGIYRYKDYAVSVGVQTNRFKYVEATLGIGIMF